MTNSLAAAVEAEMKRAESLLASLAGEEIATLTVNSLDSLDAPFLGLIVSKLSPMIGNLLERRITHLLAQVDLPDEHGLHWLRQDPGFPDALLVDGNGTSTDSGFEVKAWYSLSTELTGRFRESTNLLAARDVRVVIVAWMMSHVVYGTPTILGVMSFPGSSVAEYRDLHYHKPPNYLIVEPQDTTARTQNLRQTNVNGYRLQETSPAALLGAKEFAQNHAGRDAPPHSPLAQELVTQLMNLFSYRLDTNFAKVDRIDHPGIEAFKTQVLSMSVRGRTLKGWIRLLKSLADDGNTIKRAQAERAIQEIYDEL